MRQAAATERTGRQSDILTNTFPTGAFGSIQLQDSRTQQKIPCTPVKDNIELPIETSNMHVFAAPFLTTLPACARIPMGRTRARCGRRLLSQITPQSSLYDIVGKIGVPFTLGVVGRRRYSFPHRRVTAVSFIGSGLGYGSFVETREVLDTLLAARRRLREGAHTCHFQRVLS